MADPGDELFEVTPGEFTARRNALAKELKERADDEGARRVAALKRPTLAVWAVNQLGRRHGDLVAELIAVQRTLGEAAAPAELHEGSVRRRRLVGDLTDRARALLEEAELSASDQTVERIRSMLLAINSPGEEELLRAGRFEREPEAGGFEDAFAGMALDEVPEQETAIDETARREAEELAAAAREARAAANKLARAATKLRVEADAAESEARAAERRADELQERAAAAAKRL